MLLKNHNTLYTQVNKNLLVVYRKVTKGYGVSFWKQNPQKVETQPYAPCGNFSPSGKKAHAPGVINPNLCSIRQLGVFLLPQGGLLSSQH